MAINSNDDCTKLCTTFETDAKSTYQYIHIYIYSAYIFKHMLESDCEISLISHMHAFVINGKIPFRDFLHVPLHVSWIWFYTLSYAELCGPLL